ncbi:MAG: class I SAM-dependent methyltransferase [Actinomycetota bacterium]
MSNFKYDPELYDLQINWESRLDREVKFLLEIIKEGNVERVLDIGCGTAHHLQALSGHLKQLAGIDPLPETIAYGAKEVAAAENIELKVGGFEDLNNLDIGKFGLIMSLGNTLPLLKTKRKVKLALKDCRKKLVKGGTALFQFLNFDRKMIEANSYYRPKTVKYRGKQYIFLKHFEYGKINTRADFLITELDAGGEVSGFWTNSSYFCTLKKNVFIKMARNAGFKGVRLLAPDGKQEFNVKKHISLYAILNN